MQRTILILMLLSLITVSAVQSRAFQDNPSDRGRTKVVLLGTGTPNPDPNHSGCSVAVVVDETPYLVDFGPGLVRKASQLSPRYEGSIPALDVSRLTRAFLTHLHSDHTTGYPDLILTPWVEGRTEPLEVYGPEGIGSMTEHILEAYREDIRYRLYGAQPANNQGWRVHTHDIHEGVIYTDDKVKVEAFRVLHGTWPEAFGFRFTTPDKVIVISGDTRPCENILSYANGADILIHEVYSQKGFEAKASFWQTYHAQNHTSTLELGKIAKQTKPGLLVLYHILFWGATEQDLLDEIASVYSGPVIAGSDLDIFP